MLDFWLALEIWRWIQNDICLRALSLVFLSNLAVCIASSTLRWTSGHREAFTAVCWIPKWWNYTDKLMRIEHSEDCFNTRTWFSIKTISVSDIIVSVISQYMKFSSRAEWTPRQLTESPGYSGQTRNLNWGPLRTCPLLIFHNTMAILWEAFLGMLSHALGALGSWTTPLLEWWPHRK